MSTAPPLLLLALLVVAGLLIALGLAITLRRLWGNARDRRTAERETRLRPRLLHLLSQDEPDLSPLDHVDGPEGRMLETIAWQLVPKVRGTSRSAVVSWLERRGAIDAARQRTQRRGAVGRAKAAEHLGLAGLPVALAELVALLDDPHADVRIVAARALGRLGDAAAVPALFKALEGRNAVAVSLVSMSLLHLGTVAVSGLEAALDSQSALVRSVAAELLGMHGALTATAKLVDLLHEDLVIDVRVRAAGALGRIGSPHSIEALTTSMHPRQPREIRLAATRALGLVGGGVATENLAIALHNSDGELARVAAEGLSKLGAKGIEILTHGAANADIAVRERAEDWLARVDLTTRSRRRRHVITLS